MLCYHQNAKLMQISFVVSKLSLLWATLVIQTVDRREEPPGILFNKMLTTSVPNSQVMFAALTITWCLLVSLWGIAHCDRGRWIWLGRPKTDFFPHLTYYNNKRQALSDVHKLKEFNQVYPRVLCLNPRYMFLHLHNLSYSRQPFWFLPNFALKQYSMI